MNTTLGRDHRVQFVDDHVLDFTHDGLESRRRDGDGQTLGCRDENMRRIAQHFLSVGLRRITCSKTDSNFLGAVGQVLLSDFIQRSDEVALDIVGEGLDGRDVDGVNLLLQLLLQR